MLAWQQATRTNTNKQDARIVRSLLKNRKGPRRQKPRAGKQKPERIATKHCTVSLWRLPAGNFGSTVIDADWHGEAGWPTSSKLK